MQGQATPAVASSKVHTLCCVTSADLQAELLGLVGSNMQSSSVCQ